MYKATCSYCGKSSEYPAYGKHVCASCARETDAISKMNIRELAAFGNILKMSQRMIMSAEDRKLNNRHALMVSELIAIRSRK